MTIVLKNICIKLLMGYRATSKAYIKKLRKLGVEVGEDVTIFRPFNTTIDVQNPHLLKIGNHVQITGPVTILTHDYSWCVLKRKYSKVIGNQKSVVLGDNIFIGWGTTILAGSNVGDNVIIGANSVIHGNVASNAVYAGNPAKYIMSLEEYYQKRLHNQLQEAVNYVRDYYKRFGKIPLEKELDEYFYLFTTGYNSQIEPAFRLKLQCMKNYQESLEDLKKNNPYFKNYNEFLQYCFKKENTKK